MSNWEIKHILTLIHYSQYNCVNISLKHTLKIFHSFNVTLNIFEVLETLNIKHSEWYLNSQWAQAMKTLKNIPVHESFALFFFI